MINIETELKGKNILVTGGAGFIDLIYVIIFSNVKHLLLVLITFQLVSDIT